ncbi:MAG: TrkH family potassium uptake protein [Planctomycetota bacterium]
MNLACVLHLIGRLCTVLAGLLLLPLLVCLVDGTLFGPTSFAFVISSLSALVTGLALQLAFRFRQDRFQLPEAFASVAAAWLVFSLLGALPFLLTGAIPRFVDAYFETMSGATTTGASVLSDPALLGRPLLLWRSLLHLIGGLGIVALSVAILPALGAGGNFLFQAEAVGPEKDKLVPRISTMSKLLWTVYIGLTAATVSGYVIAGMAPFDAVCHGFATVGTGGFSTQSDSFAGYSPAIQWVSIVFMYLAGTNFVLLLSVVRGRPATLWRNTEWRTYTAILILVAAFCAVVRQGSEGMESGLEPLVRSSLFSVVSLATTTGFGTVDFDRWPAVLHFALLFVMLCGACAGSTGGGSKMTRLVLWWKAAGRELRRLLQPTGVFVVKVQQRTIAEGVVLKSLGFLALMLVAWVLCSVVLMVSGLGPEAAISAALASLSCVGPGFDAVGPTQNYGFVTDVGKWTLIFAMLLGRLELLSLLVLLSPGSWRR